MKTTINLNEEQRQQIASLLTDTFEQFTQAFRELANDDTRKSRRKFVAYWCTLADLVLKAQKGGAL